MIKYIGIYAKDFTYHGFRYNNNFRMYIFFFFVLSCVVVVVFFLLMFPLFSLFSQQVNVFTPHGQIKFHPTT